MTELKCRNCRETFVANRMAFSAADEKGTVTVKETPIHEIARFCPYCGSSSLELEIKEGPPTPTIADDAGFMGGVSDYSSEDLAEEEEKPRRSRKR